MKTHHRLLAALAALSLSPVALADNGDASPRRFENTDLTVRISPRTPQQVGAFYEARGFPPTMIDLIKRQCFLTVGIHNKSRDIIWLDLAQWRFTAEDGPLQRRSREWWREQWQAIDAPMPSQSTFRWTLLPDRLDFRPDEAEGGNVALPRDGRTFTLEAVFATGADKQGQAITVRFDNMRCAEDKTP